MYTFLCTFQSEYVEHFDSRTLVTDPIPLIPAPATKGTDLNFLKPGSREVLHRPVYVHEYLPPMFPGKKGKAFKINVPAKYCQLVKIHSRLVILG